jgi:hypothetical protein
MGSTEAAKITNIKAIPSLGDMAVKGFINLPRNGFKAASGIQVKIRALRFGWRAAGDSFMLGNYL